MWGAVYAVGGDGQRSIPMSWQYSASQSQVRRRLLTYYQAARSSRPTGCPRSTGGQDTSTDAVRQFDVPWQPAKGSAPRAFPLPYRAGVWSDLGAPVWCRGEGSFNVRHRGLFRESDHTGAGLHHLRSHAAWAAGNKTKAVRVLLSWPMMQITRLVTSLCLLHASVKYHFSFADFLRRSADYKYSIN